MTPEETWKLCLNFCEKELSKQQYTTWIKPLSGDVDEKLKQLTISAPNQFVLQWVKERLTTNYIACLRKAQTYRA